MPSFVISKIVIHQDCNPRIRKNLQSTSYQFTQDLEVGFFGTNISIQAVVGMNGSGKSSLLEIMFRMINNLAAMMYHKVDCRAAEALRYVRGVYADLHYFIGTTEGVLMCRDTAIGFTFGDKKVRFGEKAENWFDGYIDYTNAIEADMRNVASNFFYTIVSNYSMQAYVASDYQDEVTMSFDRKKNKWTNNRSSVWLHSLFHKNDGYMCPINLNPYRYNGIIDMNNELKLTMYRVMALLIEFKRSNIQYLKGYELNRIDYIFRKEKLVSNFKNKYEKESVTKKFDRIITSFKEASNIVNQNSVANLILDMFMVKSEKAEDDFVIWAAKLYLVSKVLTIASKYPTYRKFVHLGDAEKALELTTTNDERRLVKKLAKQVKEDKSHISIKVKQVLYFINHYKNVPDKFLFHKKFTYKQYEEWLQGREIEHSVYDRTQILPPPFFHSEIIMNKMDGTDMVGQTPLCKMSSGERQFIYMTSSIIYHLLNLRSVRKGRPKYRHFNIVLDEVEICFHPEYQRVFIYEFIRLVKLLGFLDRCGINILLTTHSPFILSDIPKSNILYLEEGKPLNSSDFKNPFAANVNDILKQSFFLKKGFMGALAQRKIGDLALFLSDKHIEREEYDMSLAPRLIEKIGDPLLKKHMEHMLDSFMLKHPFLQDENSRKNKENRIVELEMEIKRIKESMK